MSVQISYKKQGLFFLLVFLKGIYSSQRVFLSYVILLLLQILLSINHKWEIS